MTNTQFLQGREWAQIREEETKSHKLLTVSVPGSKSTKNKQTFRHHHPPSLNTAKSDNPQICEMAKTELLAST